MGNYGELSVPQWLAEARRPRGAAPMLSADPQPSAPPADDDMEVILLEGRTIESIMRLASAPEPEVTPSGPREEFFPKNKGPDCRRRRLGLTPKELEARFRRTAA